MTVFEEKNYKTHQKSENEETEQVLETDSDMSGLLEWVDWEFNTIVNNMLMDLNNKVDGMQEQMDNIIAEVEILMKNQKEMPELRNTKTEMKTPLMGSLEDWTWLRKESLSIRRPL